MLCKDPVLPVGDSGCCLQYLPGPWAWVPPDPHWVAAPIPMTPAEEGLCRDGVEEEEGAEEEEVASLSV